MRKIPLLAPWTESDHFEPIAEVMAGGMLSITNGSQLDAEGNVAVSGVFFVGDAVRTTSPARGGGISPGLQQAGELITLLDRNRFDYGGVARQFDAWCVEHMRPWFADHVECDAQLLGRWQ